MLNKFLVQLVQEIKVDLRNEEIQDVRSAVFELVSRILQQVERKLPIFKSKELFQCGSMSEGTRIWKSGGSPGNQAILEYDILSILERLNEKSVRTKRSCTSFMEATDSAKVLPYEFTKYYDQETEGKINLRYLFFIFRIELLKALDSLCSCLHFECETMVVKGQEMVIPEALVRTDSHSELCSKCQVHKTSGRLIVATGPNTLPLTDNCSLLLIWKRNKPENIIFPVSDNEDLKTDLLVYTDLLPVIEIMNVEDRNHDLFLVPKWCKAEHPTCWKVSHCRLEIEMMQSTAQVHRNCYMVLKFMLDNFLSELGGYKETPTTYIMKTAVLTHIRCCNRTDDLSLFRCTCDVLETLSDAYKDGILSHIVTGYNLLDTLTGEGFSDVDLAWHMNRNKVLSRFWGFLDKALRMKDDPTATELSVDDFGEILKWVRTISYEYGRCWIESDCKITMLPDEDTFLTLLKEGSEVTDRLVITREGDDSVSWEDIFNVPASSFFKSAHYRMNTNRKQDQVKINKLMAEGYTEKTKQYLEKIGYWTLYQRQDVYGTNETSEDETQNEKVPDKSSGAANSRDETGVDEDTHVLYDRKKAD